MNTYKIEHKILTLAHCAVMNEKNAPATFEIENIKFTHWDFDLRNDWLIDAWLVSASVEAESYHKAVTEFRKKLSFLIPRISLISLSDTPSLKGLTGFGYTST